jgi:hypothetical protein
MHAVGIPADSDVERLERRMRSLSDRLEEVEDLVDQLAGEVAALRSAASAEDPSTSTSSASS